MGGAISSSDARKVESDIEEGKGRGVGQEKVMLCDRDEI